jgi:osmotically-inducible protein OsmY
VAIEKRRATAAEAVAGIGDGATVMLSGFAKSQAERSNAEMLARKVTGVRNVRNEIVVRP